MTQQTLAAPKTSMSRWVDWLAGLITVAIGLGGWAYWSHAGFLNLNLFTTNQWSWYMVRAAGLTAFLMLAASMLWGVFLSSHIVKDWVPGPVTMLFHATTSWLAVALSLAHMGLLLFDSYYSYTLSNLLVPFTGPYRPFAVGLGIIAFWGILAVTVSFSMRKLIGRRAWLWLHYTSYAAFGLVSVHALMAGTDATRPGMLIILAGFSVLVAAMLTMRVFQSRASRQPAHP